jgi:hypothetical protein
LVERWPLAESDYPGDVARALQGKLRILGILPFAADEDASVRNGAGIFETLVRS